MFETATLLLLIAIYVGIAAYRLPDQITAPEHIFAGGLFFQYAIVYIFFNTKLHLMTNILYLSSLLAFLLGLLIAYHNEWEAVSRVQDLTGGHDVFSNRVLIRAFLFIGIIGYILTAIEAYHRAQYFPGRPFYSLRYVRTQLGHEYGIAKYLILGLHIGNLLQIINSDSWKRWVPFSVLWASYAIFIMAKALLLYGIVAPVGTAIFVRQQKQEEPPVKLLGRGALVAVAGTALLTTLSNENPGFDRAIRYISLYIGGPLLRFNEIYPIHCSGPPWGKYSFYMVAKVLAEVGFGNVAYDPECFNYTPTYSVLGVPYVDFGLIGPPLVLGIVGVVVGLIYRFARTGSKPWIGIYGIYLFPLSIAFYSYHFTMMGYFYHVMIFLGVAIAAAGAVHVPWVKPAFQNATVIRYISAVLCMSIDSRLPTKNAICNNSKVLTTFAAAWDHSVTKSIVWKVLRKNSAT